MTKKSTPADNRGRAEQMRRHNERLAHWAEMTRKIIAGEVLEENAVTPAPPLESHPRLPYSDE